MLGCSFLLPCVKSQKEAVYSLVDFSGFTLLSLGRAAVDDF